MRRKKWWLAALTLITVFQVISMVQVLFDQPAENALFVLDGKGLDAQSALFFGIFILVEWVYFIAMSIARKHSDPALELVAFFLTGIGLVVVAGANKEQLKTQFIAVMLGIVCFAVMLWLIGNVDRAMLMRTPMAAAAIGLLVLTLILARNIQGAFNWLQIGGMSIQPSEFVKVAFVFVGASTLDKLQTTRSLTKYIIFCVVCVALLFLMRDLGTALIFFFTFLVLAFMRSGDFRTLVLVCAAAAMAAGLVVLIRSDFVMERFSTYRHVWDDIYGKGYQQTRVLIYSVSGGLLGVGIGKGNLKDVSAATEDLVFGMICEEWGIIIGILVVLCILFIAFHSIRCAAGARSAFYAISGIAAGMLMLFQAALNVFGVTDLLPLTGVTLPFISRGGSSAICCWALLAFIKAADNRTWIKRGELGATQQ
ncbi:MAG: FtsW/RodA/SpoVE family cell cycle protein [Clostridia bacterium]|nr:FtsW/RodA/SpoVE family cell cycle protein [Clostridia bacterium]